MPISRIVLLSGPVCAGKSTLCELLVARFNARLFRTKDIILKHAPNLPQQRGAMQEFGDRLDRRTGGAWVCDEVTRYLSTADSSPLVTVDAVHILKQVDAFRSAFGHHVFHIHLEAPPDTLAKRYKKQRQTGYKEFSSYAELARNETESRIGDLAESADVVIDTAKSLADDVLVRAASHLGLYGREAHRLVDVLVGGQYGSEGKGHIASYLAKEYDVLVRIGGPNAGHKVFASPKPYTHHQLPSGTRFCDARLIIGPGAVINPDFLLTEVAQCQVDANRLCIDPQAMIIQPRDIAREVNLKKTIGSTGQGVGYATARRITGRADKNLKLAKDVPDLRPFIRETCLELEKAYAAGQKVFLEGTQGTGLSIYHGRYPYVTSRDTTASGCLAEAGIAPSRVRKILMVCRTYPIRVQDPKDATSGYMSQEITWEEVAIRSGVEGRTLRKTEKTSTTNRDRRVGEFDWVLLRKAASLNGPTDIALTFVDYLSIDNARARRFEQLDNATIRFIEEVEHTAATPVSLISTRFDSRSIIDRRTW